MSKYTQEQETEIVRDAMTLTTAIKIGEEELQKQKNEKFKPKPAAPVRKILEIPQIQPQIPPAPKTKYKYSDYLSNFFKKISSFIKKNLKLSIPIGIVIALLIIFAGVFFIAFLIFAAMITVPVLFILSLIHYNKKKNDLNQQLAQSPEYLKAVEEAKRVAREKQQKVKEEIAKQQAGIDEKYNSDLENYNNVIIPKYNQEYDAWKIAQKLKIEMLEEEVQLNKETLEALYTSTKIISNRYRHLEILRWLYDELSSSDVTIERAIDLYNEALLNKTLRNVGKEVADAINDMHSSMRCGFNAVYDAIDEGNETLAKTRRDQNLANTAGIIQRHNLNKMIKTQNGMLDEYFNQ